MLENPRYSPAGAPYFDLQATNKSQIAEKALHFIAALYEVEREARELEPGIRQRIRQDKVAPFIDALHTWMIAQRQLVPEGSTIAKALDYSLKRWIALTRYLDDGAVPIDNNWCETRPVATGRSRPRVCKKPLISRALCKTLISMDVEVTSDLALRTYHFRDDHRPQDSRGST